MKVSGYVQRPAELLPLVQAIARPSALYAKLRTGGGTGLADDGRPTLIRTIARRPIEIWHNGRLVVSDIAASGLAAAVAVWLGTGALHGSGEISAVTLVSLAAMFSAAVIFPIFGLYRRHTRSQSLQDAVLITVAVLVALLFQALVMNAVLPSAGLDTKIYAIQFLVAVPALAMLRLAARHNELVRQLRRTTSAGQAALCGRVPVLLCGTGTNCDLFVRSCRAPDARYRPVGIIDDARDTTGLVFHEVEILGSLLRLERLLETLNALDILPQRLFLTEPVTHFESDGIRRLLTWAEAHGVKVSRLPQLGDPYSEDAPSGAAETRTIDPETILDRPQQVVERSLLRNLFRDRRVLITGGGGSIGSELSRQVASFGPAELVLIELNEFNAYSIDQDLQRHFPDIPRRVHVANIRDAERISAIFRHHMPELVFNAAALKHVPLVESNPCEGVLTNVIGTRNVADAARAVGAMAMVQISTDKAVNTTNVMGATKRVAELYVQAQDRITCDTEEATRFFSVRFGNVLGSSGSLIPLFQKQISQGGPLTVTDARMTRFFMTVREAVELTLVAAAKGLALKTGLGQIFVLDMGEPVKIVDIAERMIRLAGLRPGEDICIEIIGKRPGEKLFEELFDESEVPLDCGIPGLQAAVPAGVPIAQLRAAIHRLQRDAIAGKDLAVKRGLKELVPGYGVNSLRPLNIKVRETQEAVSAVKPHESVTRIMLPAGGFPEEHRIGAGS